MELVRKDETFSTEVKVFSVDAIDGKISRGRCFVCRIMNV